MWKKKKRNYGKLCNFHLKWKLFLYYTKEHLFYNLIFFFLNCYLTFSFCWREKKNFFTSFLTKYIYRSWRHLFWNKKKFVRVGVLFFLFLYGILKRKIVEYVLFFFMILFRKLAKLFIDINIFWIELLFIFFIRSDIKVSLNHFFNIWTIEEI